MFFDAGQTQGALGATVKPAPGAEGGANRHLNQQQFGPQKGAGEAAEGAEATEGAAAGAEGAAAGAEGLAGIAELAPLALL